MYVCMYTNARTYTAVYVCAFKPILTVPICLSSTCVCMLSLVLDLLKKCMRTQLPLCLSIHLSTVSMYPSAYLSEYPSGSKS